MNKKNEYSPVETLGDKDLPGLIITVPGVGSMNGVEYTEYQRTGVLPPGAVPAKPSASADFDEDDLPDPEFVKQLQADEAERAEGRRQREEKEREDAA